MRKDDLRAGAQATALGVFGFLPREKGHLSPRPLGPAGRTLTPLTGPSRWRQPTCCPPRALSFTSLLPPCPTPLPFHNLLFEKVDTGSPRRLRVWATVSSMPWLHPRPPTLTGAGESSRTPQLARRHTEARRALATASTQATSCHCAGAQTPSSPPDRPFVQPQVGGFSSSPLSQRDPSKDGSHVVGQSPPMRTELSSQGPRNPHAAEH